MEIGTIEIKHIAGGFLKRNCENVRHMKALPFLSVAQAVHGFYEIGLNGGALSATEEGGAFVAPAGIRQNIVHHNGPDGYMEAQWAFIHVTVNDLFAFEDVFDLPVLIPARQCDELGKLIFTIRTTPDLCKKYAAAYQLIDLLMALSTVKDTDFDSGAAQLKKYIDEHYMEPITKEDLATVAFCSVPNLYRLFQRYFQMSPHNYINKIRLEKAAALLENSTFSIAETAEKVGFDNPFYFSKLFKARYQLSPKKYREDVFSVKK